MKEYNLVCDQCGKKFVKTRLFNSKSNTHFCSRTCQATYFNVKNGKGYVVHKKGYIQKFVGHDYKNNTNGYYMEHRCVMEQHLGRCLEKNEIVHHRNGIKDDNRIENLELLTTKNHLPSYDNMILKQLNDLLMENVELKKRLEKYENKCFI